MAVDRGGLNYTISVKDQFSKATAKFVSEITRARSAFAEFKTEAAELSATNTRIAVSINKATQASTRKTAQMSAEAEAERKLTRILRDRIVQEELRELAARKGVTLSQQKTRQLTIEQEAERRLLAMARSAAVSRRIEEEAQRRGIDLSRRKVRQLTVEEEAQRKVAAAIRRRAVLSKTEELAYAQGIDLSKKKVRQLTVEEEAIRRIEKAERERAIAARIAAINESKFIGPKLPPGLQLPQTGKPPAPADPATLAGLKRARELIDQFRSSVGATNDGGNDLLFTFRRLFGVLAAFQAARAIFRAFTDLIRAGIEFNAVVETTRLGIASLIVAVGELRNEQGEVVEGAQAFALAQREAARQQRLLRVDALKTTATFQELLDTFQVALGPGIAAGLNLDEVREFSVRVSQAASAIGVAQQQLSEEIRGLLTGAIRPGQTRIAGVLQITPEDVRRAREAGQLFEFLTERFKTFQLTGEEAAKTFNGLTQILKGAVQEIAGLAAQPLFDELKETMQEMVNLLLSIDESGAVIINPEAIEAIAPIFAGIQSALVSIRDTAGDIGFGDLRSSAEIIGVSIAVAGEVLAGVVRGIVQGFTVVVAIIEEVADLLGGQGKSLQEIVTLSTKYSIIFGSILVIAGLIGTALNAIISPLRLAVTIVTSLATGVLKVWQLFLRLPLTIRAALIEVTILLAIIAGVGEAVRQITEAIFGVNLSLRQTIDLITLGFIGAIFDAISFIEELAFAVKNGINEAFTSAAESALSFINRSKQLIAAFLGDSKEVEALVAEQEAADVSADNARRLRRIQAERELADIRRENEAKSLAFTEQIAGIVGEAAGQDALGQIPTTIEELLGGLTKVFGEFDLGLSSFFQGLQSGEGFDLNTFFNLEDFTAKIKAAQEAAAANAEGLNLTPRGVPVTDEQRRELADAQQKLALTQQEVAAARAINDLERERASQDVVRLQELKNQLAELQTQLDTQRALNELDREKVSKAIGGAQGEDQRLALEEQLATLNAQQIADEELLKARIDETNIALERQRQIVEGTINEGFSQGLSDFANQFASAFQAGINIAGGLLQSFTSFVSDSIVSAFDPSNDTSIKERFGRFLQDIAKLIISELLKLQIAKLLVGFGFSGGGSVGGGGGSVGLAEGGNVPRRGRASPAHYGFGVRGLAGGGQATPPPGVDRRDTVPIWAQSGEFMQSLAAVRTYGRDFMEALNRRVLDPNALRSLAGLGGTRRIMARAHRGPGFATGGLISEQIAKQTAAQSFASSQPAAGGVSRAVVVAGEDEFDKLVSGGSNSLLRWLRENKDTANGILQRG